MNYKRCKELLNVLKCRPCNGKAHGEDEAGYHYTCFSCLGTGFMLVSVSLSDIVELIQMYSNEDKEIDREYIRNRHFTIKLNIIVNEGNFFKENKQN